MKVQLSISPNTYEWSIAGEALRFGSTDNAGVLERAAEIERQLRFRRLSFGRDGDDAHQIVDMELIWLVALMNTPSKFCVDSRAFKHTLSENVVWSTAPRAWNDWNLYAECGKCVGVDYMVDAYLDGVPLEHVLADVEFLPDHEVLDPFWYTDARRVMSLGA